MPFSRFAVATLAFTVGFTSSATAEGSAPDAWITARLKIDLVTTSYVRAKNVHVDTIEGRVTLYGTVDNAEKKRDAESVARAVKGVRDVRNLLQIVPEPSRKTFAGADDRLEARVSKRLQRDVLLRRSAIQVKAVNKGIVVLSGKAEDLFDYQHAVQSISDLSTVRGVISEIESSDALPDIDGSMITAGMSGTALDAWITTEAKMRLLSDPEVAAPAIHVDTQGGVIKLFGTVPTWTGRVRAVAHALEVDFALGVIDDLEVVPKSRGEILDRSDAEIQRDVEAVFTNHAELADVRVHVEDRVVQLIGDFGSRWWQLQAMTIARGIEGVRSVDCVLGIGPSG